MININTEQHWDNKFKRIKKFRNHPFSNLIKIMDDFVKHPGTIVDLGCALGEFPVMLKQHYPEARIIGIDFSTEALNRCKKASPEIEWLRAVLPDLSIFKDGSIDAITIIETLEHLDRPENPVNEMHRVLKNGGIGIISVPYGKTLDLREHVNSWNSEGTLGKFIEKTKFGKSYEFKSHGKILFFKLNLAVVLIKQPKNAVH